MVGAEEQQVIAKPQIVQPNIQLVANFQVTPPQKFSLSRESGQIGFKV